MSIYRIGETQAKPESVEELRDFLISYYAWDQVLAGL